MTVPVRSMVLGKEYRIVTFIKIIIPVEAFHDSNYRKKTTYEDRDGRQILSTKSIPQTKPINILLFHKNWLWDRQNPKRPLHT